MAKYYDVTSVFLKLKGVSGIPKAVYEYGVYVLKDTGIKPIIFVNGSFYHVNLDKTPFRLNVSWDITSDSSYLKKPLLTFWEQLKEFCRRFFFVLRYKKVKKSISSPEKKRFEYLQKIKTKKVNFESNDVLVSLGVNWLFDEYNSGIRNIKSKGVSYILMIYDIIPTKLPYLYNRLNSEVFTSWLNESLPLADKVLSISQSTKSDIIEYCNYNRLTTPEIAVVRLGESMMEIKSAPIEYSNFVLTVGTVEIRKNHTLLLDIWRKLAQDPDLEGIPKLVIVGQKGWLNFHIEHQINYDPLLKNNVIWIKDAEDDLLSNLYQNCLFTLYPSLYEGWGLPISESFFYGKVCVSSDSSSMNEIAPEFQICFNPNDFVSWYNKVKDLILNPMDRKELEHKIENGYKNHQWSDASVELLEAIDFCLSR